MINRYVVVLLSAVLGCSGEAPPAQVASDPQATSPESKPLQQPVTSVPRLLTDEELSAGWISLFDGESLYGWQATSNANWHVADGAIVASDGEEGLLCTKVQFCDYIFKVEFRSAPGTNSGIFLHTPTHPTDPAVDCYELNIAPLDNPFPTGSLVKRQKVAGEYESDDWQSLEVKMAGGLVEVSLEGEKILTYEDDTPLQRGYIGLQKNEGKIEFRNLKLLPLGRAPLFTGVDLQGWRPAPADSLSEFTVTDDETLNVKNGRGHLETVESFGDFVLQLECISHAKHLNSGIFFRCIPGETMNGYEAQIQNGFENGDRAQPTDCGTGGIFRRQNARMVAADDQQWFFMTIVADGPTINVWVNGLLVTDWTDERAPHDNPRSGLRLKPGTIQIQGHDPTTNLSFRNLTIARYRERSLANSND